MRRVRLVRGALLMGALLAARAARSAYDEAHEIGDDAAVRIDASGVARVEHAILLHVVAGQKHALDVVGVEPNAVPEPTASITAEDGSELSAPVEVREGSPRVFRIAIEGPKGLRRGRYRVRLAYRVDLVGAKELVREGGVWRLTWTSPLAREGYDAAHVVFDLPGAPLEPRAVRPGSDSPDDTVVSSLRRGIDRDTLDLARPHIAKGEAAVWSARVGPRAFTALAEPFQPPPAPPVRTHDRSRALAILLALGVLALGYGSLVRAKAQGFARACRAHGTRPRALTGLGPFGRGLAAGLLFAAGVGVQVGARWLIGGAVLIASAMALAALAGSPAPRAPRGPGRWLAVRADEAFAIKPTPNHPAWLDPGRIHGVLALFLALGTVVGLAAIARRLDASLPYVIAMDALALVPLFGTGRSTQLPPGPARSVRPLRRLLRRFAKRPGLRVTPWLRVPLGAAEPDEIRLLVLPRVAMPGVVGIEVGFGWWCGANGYGASPEVLVRVLEATAASARMTTLAPFAMPVPGRRPEERVYRLRPRLPVQGWTAALVERLGRELVDRRGEPHPGSARWAGQERRLPPAERAAREARAAA